MKSLCFKALMIQLAVTLFFFAGCDPDPDPDPDTDTDMDTGTGTDTDTNSATQGESCDIEGPCLCVNVEHNAAENKVALKIVESQYAYYERCGDFVTIYKKNQQTSDKQRATIHAGCHWGCYLEGTFSEPRCDEGCDEIYWSPLAELTENGAYEVLLRETVEIGKQAPPADFEHCMLNYDDEAITPEAYAVYEWQNLTGQIEIELEFGCSETDNEWEATGHTASFSLSL